MSTLGSRLRDLRREADLTQDQLAGVLHINRATLANWEINRAAPDPESMTLIADYFRTSVDYLLGRTNQRNPTAESDTFDDPEIEVIFRDAKGLSPGDRRRLAQIVKDWLAEKEGKQD